MLVSDFVNDLHQSLSPLYGDREAGLIAKYYIKDMGLHPSQVLQDKLFVKQLVDHKVRRESNQNTGYSFHRLGD